MKIYNIFSFVYFVSWFIENFGMKVTFYETIESPCKRECRQEPGPLIFHIRI